MQANKDIRQFAREKKVRLWQIAEKLDMWDSNFSRKLRRECTLEEKKKILTIINELAKAREGGD